MNIKHEFVAGFLLVSVLATLALWSWGVHQRTLRFEAEAKLVTSDILAAGAQTAAVVSPVNVLPSSTPPAVVAAVKAKTLKPVASATAKATSQVFYLPCDSITNGLPPKVDVVTVPSTPPVKATVPVTIDLTGNLLIAQVVHGTAIWTGSVKGAAHSGDYTTAVEFDPTKIDMTVKVSDEIGKAIEAYDLPWHRKHLRFMCPGLGVSYNPLDVTHPVSVGVQCAYGLVW